MASNATTADGAPEKVTQAAASEDDVGDPDDTNSSNSASHAEMIVSGGMTSDVTSDEYSSKIFVLSEQLRPLRASYALALQDREDVEAQEALYSKRHKAKMHKSNTMKKDMRAIESSEAELHRTLNQLETDTQQESCSV